MIPNLHDYDMVVINTSAGKDSQVAKHVVVKAADEQEYPRSKIVCAHADLGRIEWDGTIGLARRQAEHYGLRLLVEKRPQGDLLAHFRSRWEDLKAQASAIEQVCSHWHGGWWGDLRKLSKKAYDRAKKRLKQIQAEGGKAASRASLTRTELRQIATELQGTPPWSSPTNRFCTSDHKRGQVNKLYTQLTRELGITGRKAKFINVFGFRAEESPARAAREVWSYNKRASTKTTRDVYDWLPIHKMTEDEVWLTIDEAGTPHHWAYNRGMGRLSCRFCIFAPRNQLMIAAMQKENWELFCEYVEFEEECGFTFTQAVSLKEIKDAIERGEQPDYDDNGAWNM